MYEQHRAEALASRRYEEAALYALADDAPLERREVDALRAAQRRDHCGWSRQRALEWAQGRHPLSPRPPLSPR